MRRLLLPCLQKSIGLSKQGRTAYTVLREKICEKVASVFTSHEAAKVLGLTNRMACHRTLKEFEKLKLIEQVAPSKGPKPALASDRTKTGRTGCTRCTPKPAQHVGQRNSVTTVTKQRRYAFRPGKTREKPPSVTA